MMNKRLVIYILITNLLCVFPAGHVAIPLAFFEPILIINAFTGNAESPEWWVAAAGLLLIGQIIMVAALFQTEKRMNLLALSGIVSLILATVCVYLILPKSLPLSLLTASPFIFLSVRFVKRITEK